MQVQGSGKGNGVRFPSIVLIVKNVMAYILFVSVYICTFMCMHVYVYGYTHAVCSSYMIRGHFIR